MHFTSSKRLFARPLTAACVLLACTASAFGADNFSAGRLSISSLTLGPVTYSNVVVAVGSIMSGPAASTSIGSEDSYDYSTGQLTCSCRRRRRQHGLRIVAGFGGERGLNRERQRSGLL